MTAPAFTGRHTRSRRRRQRLVHTVLRPTLGLFKDRTPLQVPDRGLQNCLNVRIKDGKIQNVNMGWEPFPPDGTQLNLDGEQALMIEQFFLRNGTVFLLFANRYDVFRYLTDTQVLEYITPIYDTGQITGVSYAAGPDETTITGSGTAWDTDPTDRNGSNNVIVNDMFHLGDSGYQTQDNTWYRVSQVNSDTEIVVEGDATSGFVNPSDYTIRQRLTGDNFDLWDSDTFPAFDTGGGLNDHFYMTNGVDYPLRYRGDTLDSDGCTRVDLGFTCRVIRYYSNMMLYMDLLESGERKPQAVRNSNVGDPEDVTTGLASEIVPMQGIDAIVNAATLSDFIVVYGERSIQVGQFVGQPFVFVYRTAVPDTGLLAREALVSFGDHHKFLSDDTAYRFNGVSATPTGNHIFREALRTISPERRAKILAHVDEEQGEVHWIVPLTTDGTGTDGGPKRAYTEHYLEETVFDGERFSPFTFRDLPATATGYFERVNTLTWDQVLSQWVNTNFRWNDRFFEAAFPINLFGDENGFIYSLGGVDTQHDGSTTLDLRSEASTPLRAAVDGFAKGTVHRVEPFMPKRASATLQVLWVLHTTDRVGGETSAAEVQAYDLTHAGERFMAFRQSARFFYLSFGTLAQNAPWEIEGWSVFVTPGSRR